MPRILWAACTLCLGLCTMPGFAQTVPTTTPSTPPVTTPPPPAALPPTGGPNSLPTAEPANAIDNSGLTPGANSFTEAQARSRLAQHGYGGVSALTKGDDGIWRGTATKDGSAVHVSVDYEGNIEPH
jgi:hypothetical protein